MYIKARHVRTWGGLSASLQMKSAGTHSGFCDHDCEKKFTEPGDDDRLRFGGFFHLENLQ